MNDLERGQKSGRAGGNMTYMLTLEDECCGPANRVLPMGDRRAEDVVKVPDEEAEGKCPSAG